MSGSGQNRRAPPPIPIPRRLYPSFQAAPSSPFPFTPSTPSKRRHNPIPSSALPSAVLLLFSLRSLYSLLPFLRPSAAPLPLLPFSFLVSLLSLLLSLLLSSLLPPSSFPSFKALAFSSPHLRPLLAKSSLLALSLLLRFHALRYCGAAATILADLSGALLAHSLSAQRRSPAARRGFAALFASLCLLSYSWDRTGCFPLSSSPPPAEGCARVWPMLLPFLSGFLGFFERAVGSWASLRQLGRRKVRLFSHLLTTLMLFFPAAVSFFTSERDNLIADVSLVGLGWPLINTVLFGVILNENFGDDKVLSSAKDLRREFVVTFFCTLVLELFYFPKLSLPGFLFCGLLMWIAVRELTPSLLNYVELGGSDPSESLHSMVMKPLRHILSERKSRKIALFLLINTAYMVVEFVAGFMSNSLGLISDACHMLFDCAALAIGLYASYISRLPANAQFNYGRGRFEVLSGYVNAVFLVLVGVLIVLESFERILDPQEISTGSLLAVSVGGLVVNVVGLVFFHEEHHHAHGGGGACSHSHSHDHPHEHHHHNHSHKKVGCDQESDMEHHHCVKVSHESSAGHSHVDTTMYHCCNHDDGNHGRKDEFGSHTQLGTVVDQHDHHSYDHDHGHHSHDHEHCSHDHNLDHHSHEHYNSNVCSHENSCEPQHEHHHYHHPHVCTHENSCESDHQHHQHCHEGHTYDSCHSSKNTFRLQEHGDLSQGPNHAHSHLSHSKELSSEGNLSKASRKHHHIDHNMEGIFLHVLADTMGSVGVVISTLLIKYKGWLVADPACSIFISVMIISSVIPLLRNSAEILLQRVPRAHERDLKATLDDLMRIKGVSDVQNLHIWNLTNTDIVGTLHLHVLADAERTPAKKRALELLEEAGVKDVTVQVECSKG